MTASDPLAAARDALDDCDAALRKLDALCCDPGRSPSMKALGDTLAGARHRLTDVGTLGGAARVVAHLEDAGARLGRLQVGCCAPARLPLYARMLENLTTAQLAIARAEGTAH